ncbi:hypothetical protein ACVIHI_008992 [Bradyrhizobium sp. USDA 4524]|uniref:hypothetical protein n=1 Tax=unclassified Bradyrhizobium TaxID=2631580 RepID=UPI0020A016E1|nr:MULTISPECIES: hypothetical protein [unclassified Bradyrhizobium]MCP1845542.1 hypothetical protein [Bradyrhizobium sp. USDA 4538]MCP1907136.1 hypothetical protein [Bradyrhizobium sp. USDA 4537]MCP1985612.1 hypothetical protein [Bradyrhizobium sp. USDA 4539]
MSEEAFKEWLRQLRFEIEQVYSQFELHPEHCRDEFEKGRTPLEAFDRIMRAAAEASAKQRFS